ncbi:Hypothetical predicted protein [Podarcis lilfordi]|uniref:Secreted protein n=1 Tax=Podarcis lilfordi TaxID=74358 RepID=A0AA35NXT0_9SAUR|nr:Hypothetical predicted protein [Podarcis lilfordi]
MPFTFPLEWYLLIYLHFRTARLAGAGTEQRELRHPPKNCVQVDGPFSSPHATPLVLWTKTCSIETQSFHIVAAFFSFPGQASSSNIAWYRPRSVCLVQVGVARFKTEQGSCPL